MAAQAHIFGFIDAEAVQPKVRTTRIAQAQIQICEVEQQLFTRVNSAFGDGESAQKRVTNFFGAALSNFASTCKTQPNFRT